MTFDTTEYNNTVFSDLNLNSEKIVGMVFEDCAFIRSSFAETKLTNCKFVNCSFKNCNLSSMEVVQSSFRDVIFEESKVIGVNWTKAKYPRMKLANKLHFRKSNVSYSNFLGLDLRGMGMEKCQAHEVDFREANLTRCDFFSTDFKGSLFNQTKLNGANFIDATNYSINPTENEIQNGKFSLPDAITLLAYLDIQIH